MAFSIIHFNRQSSISRFKPVHTLKFGEASCVDAMHRPSCAATVQLVVLLPELAWFSVQTPIKLAAAKEQCSADSSHCAIVIV